MSGRIKRSSIAFRIVIKCGLWVLLTTSMPVGMLAAGAAFFGAAYLTDAVWGLAFAGAAALLLTTGGVSTLAALGLNRESRLMRVWTPVLLTTGTLLLTTLAATALVFEPHQEEYVGIEPTEDTLYWELPTGSRLAYSLTSAEGEARSSPVIMLHGGPGGPGGLGPQEEDGLLAAAGYHVYRYHQVGAGLSNRLEDVSEYTVARHVADLEAIRQRIGAEQMILVGGSWGGQLAAYYMATYPQRVKRAVFSSPGAIWRPALQSDSTHPLPESQRGPESQGLEVEIITEAATPRFGVVYGLIQINPQAAHNLAPDKEMSAVFQRMIGPLIAGDIASCGEEQDAAYAAHDGLVPRGFGFYANMVTSASLQHVMDPRPQLRKVDIPVMVLRGECDRLSLHVHREYSEVFPDAVFIEVPDVGHSIPASPLYPELIRAFVEGDELLPVASMDAR